ncbi:MAG: hypothetical protein JW863_02300 [Chitinispirillaceae bacterium]|nr:hypothetical protein [Chitinispirillaceae bacterium]
MKIFFIVIVLFAGPFSEFASAKWYSRSKQRRLDSLRVADSLRIIDSTRVADSMRIADSCMMARYHEADMIRTMEKAQKAEAEHNVEEERRAEELKKTILLSEETSEPNTPSGGDDVTARTVVIDQHNPYARTIDSLQARIDCLNSTIYDNDARFRDMKTFAFSEKKRYLQYLMKNKMKDTSAVLDCCNRLFEVYTLKHELLLAIQKSQAGNTKTFIQYHIEEHQRKLAEVSDFLLSLSPEVPFHPTRVSQGSVEGE